MQYKYGYCKGTETHEGCGKWSLITNRTRMLCHKCNTKRLSTSKGKVQRLPSGELQLFIEIWNERPHQSQISGEPLREFNVAYFSHILTKGAYPKFRLKKENILLKTFQEHQDWEFNAPSLKLKPEWNWVFELKQKLKQEYYAI